jgi:FAD/FMN-containing dehydrogenase
LSATARPSADLQQLRPTFSGELFEPGDAGYDVARTAWNLAVDQRPAAVARPRTAEDVQAIVAFARERGLRIAPQGTGHNAAPLAHRGLDETVLLRTDLMRDVRIDPLRRRARAEAGALWIDVVAPASEMGLAALAGSSPDVGVVGYCLGGGMGWLARKLGLAANSVTAIELVTADGRFLRVDDEHEPELFWALRGGGGSYAIVTAIELELFPLAEVYAGALLWPWERASEVLHAWRAWTADLPDEVTTSARIVQVPPFPDIPEALRGRQFVVIDGAVMAGADEAERLLAPLRALGPEIDMFAMVPPVALSHIHMDPEHPVPGVGSHAMLGALPAEAIDAFVAVCGAASGSPLLVAELRHVGGALGRIPANAGALGRIAAEYVLFMVGVPADEHVGAAIVERIDMLLDAMSPYCTGGSYLNFAEQPTNTASAFSEDAYAALQAVKAEYDPTDLIQANNPVPAAATA